MDYLAYFDASYDEDNKTSISGFIIKDVHQNILLKGTQMNNGVKNSVEAEFLALIDLIKKIREMNLDKVKILGDCKAVINSILGIIKIQDWNIDYVIEINKLIKTLSKYEFKWIHRKKNKEAHKIIKTHT